MVFVLFRERRDDALVSLTILSWRRGGKISRIGYLLASNDASPHHHHTDGYLYYIVPRLALVRVGAVMLKGEVRCRLVDSEALWQGRGE